MAPPMDPWPDETRLMQLITGSFDFLTTDHWFARGSGSGPEVEYDLEFMHVVTRVTVTADLPAQRIDVAIAWPDQRLSPDQPAPRISLDDLLTMRVTGVAVSHSIASEDAAARTIGSSADLLRLHAPDVLAGDLGAMTDFVFWKLADRDPPEGNWWGHPVYKELVAEWRPRSLTEVRLAHEYAPIHALVHRDPERGWPLVIEFVHRHPATMDATQLIEDLIFDHGASFIDRVEDRVWRDDRFRATVADVPQIGGNASAAVARFNDLLTELRRRR